jgi:hypothetical protein
MSVLTSIGVPPWTREEIIDSLVEFSAIYADRPIQDNKGGMKAPHMFAVWFMTRKLSPDLIVESGIWRGQSTWLLEQACPQAELVCIDVNLGFRQYISKKAVYSEKDFSEQDWSKVTDRSLAFFDDHQNAYRRLQQCDWFGIKHIIFEDNYPTTRGDCYSLKKAFANAGFGSPGPQRKSGDLGIAAKIRRKFAKLIGVNGSSIQQYESNGVEPNEFDACMLRKHLEIYCEFPPFFRKDATRWGDAWNDASYPTPKPLLERATAPIHNLFRDEAEFYTWICYAKLK